MNTPTPRTDALQDELLASACSRAAQAVFQHSRQLEQELAQAKDWNTAAFAATSTASATIARLEAERDQLKKQFEISKGNTEAALNSFHAEAKQRRSAEAERDQLKELNDVLRSRNISLMDERDQLRKVAGKLAADLKVWWETQQEGTFHPDNPTGQHCLSLDAYNSLPHVIAKGKTK
jgi:TPP-dependent trihydroxycyclohexane-1,2-dione (THcHDO) dehydratase